jgi:hypothetical protein
MPAGSAHQVRHRSIKEVVLTLSVSRATVRKVIRGHKTEFKYERGVQPTPKLGDWVEVLTEILEQEAKLPKRGAALDPAAVRDPPSALRRYELASATVLLGSKIKLSPGARSSISTNCQNICGHFA